MMFFDPGCFTWTNPSLGGSSGNETDVYPFAQTNKAVTLWRGWL